VNVSAPPVQLAFRPQTQTTQTHHHTTAVIAQATNPAQCHTSTEQVLSYQNLLASELNQINRTIDNLRQAAMVSGESYQSFDSQVNTAFASYNANVESAYTTIRQTMNGCPITIASPTYFNSFTP
jgi:uncharacterized protein YoxC